MIYIHLDQQMEDKLNTIANNSNKTTLFHIKKAIAEYIRHHEEVQKDLFRDY